MKLRFKIILFLHSCLYVLITFYSLTEDEAKMLEINTRDQSNSELWRSERRKRLTASNFGKVIKQRETTSVKNIICFLLYTTAHSKAISHGKEYENDAKRKFEEMYGKKVDECGLFVDPRDSYLAASPGETFKHFINKISH